jgi:hypothetical protein
MRADTRLNAAATVDLRCTAEVVQILEASAGEAAQPARFSMVAYTGVPMRLEGFSAPVVIDLDSVQVPRQAVPALRNHDPNRMAGHTTAIEVSPQRVKAAGVLSGLPEHTDEVRHTAKQGFPWQASLGASVEQPGGKMEFVARGESCKVNGRNWDGPLYVARGATIREISLVPMGADGNTSAAVAAAFHTGEAMNFEQWLQARGFDPAKITEQEKTVLKAAFDAEQKLPAPRPAPTVAPPAVPPDDEAARLQARRAAEAAEDVRVLAIRRLTAQEPELETEVEENGQRRRVNLRAHAIQSGMSAQDVELAVLRGTRARPAPFGYVPSTPEVTDRVLEAAALQAGRYEFTQEDRHGLHRPGPAGGPQRASGAASACSSSSPPGRP